MRRYDGTVVVFYWLLIGRCDGMRRYVRRVLQLGRLLLYH